ncbi:MAG: DUF5979 domain-containing protein [Lachnospiraceae bacterium]|nr:DUF5979 domain-containing protein [Lachnospiraceae bacterium]
MQSEAADVPQPAMVYSAECAGAEVSVDVPEGAFFEPVTLHMDTVENGTPAYQQAEEALSRESEYDAMLAFDIYFMNTDGQEIEPAEAVTVSLNASISGEEEITEGSLQITHIEEESGNASAQVVASEEEGTLSVADTEVSAEFTVGSFSTYTLTWLRANPIYIQCIDMNGNGIGSDRQDNISREGAASAVYPGIYNYTYSKAVIAGSASEAANGGTEIARIRRSNSGWQYNTSSSGGTWRDVGNRTIYFLYEKGVDVSVYIAGRHLDKRTNFSQEMLDLLNVNGINAYGYFDAGTLRLDLSRLSSNDKTKMVATDADWDYILSELKNNLVKASSNPDNLIAQYAEQVLRDYGKTQNQMFSGMWVAGNGIDNATRVDGNGVQSRSGGSTWHLDIRFQTVRINYIYGNNGITTGNIARDGTTAGTKVFITGATMDYTPTVTAPKGYKIIGYYSDPDCSDGNEWDAVNQPINEDTNVYIKIVPKEDVVINYVVQEGEGTVTNPSHNDNPVHRGYEYFNPSTGTVIGSTAAPADNWEFEGWYSDPELTQKVSGDKKYVPETPGGGWPEGKEYTYYAKFVRKTMDVTVTKSVTGNMGDTSRDFSFTLTDADGNKTTFGLQDGKSQTVQNLPVGSVITITESGAEEFDTSLTYGGASVTPTEQGGKTYQITLSADKKDIVVTNERQTNPPTGIHTGNPILHLAVIAFAALFAVVMFVLLRRRRYS